MVDSSNSEPRSADAVSDPSETSDSSETAEPSAEDEHPAPERGLLAEVWLAIKGDSTADYTAGSIGRAILLLAVPMVLETIMESIFAVVDIFFVSKLGAEAVAAVGLTESLMAILYTVAIGLSIGVTAMVARRIGEKDPEGAARTAVQAIALGLGFAVVVGVAGAIYAPELLRLMGADEATVEIGTSYTRTMLGGNATVVLLFLINAIFRGAGDAAVAMRVLWTANLINIFLDPALIFGWGPFPELGVWGAAVATNIGRGTAVVLQLVILFRGAGRVQLSLDSLRLKPATMARLVRLSATGMFQVFVGTASWIILMRVLASFGANVLAGYTIAIRVVLFALFPSWGMSNAAATMVGQALGAGKPERAERAVWTAGRLNFVFLGLTGIVFVVFAPQIIGFFTTDPEPFQWGVLSLRIIAAGFPFYAYGMVLTQSFNGAGDTWTPTWLNILCFWMFEIPLAYYLAHGTGVGAKGVPIAIAIAFSALAVASAVLFRRGTWKHKVV